MKADVGSETDTFGGIETAVLKKSNVDEPLSLANNQKIMGKNDIAVVIGIEKYDSLPSSDYSAADAKTMKDYLKALGFKERNIEFITNEKATNAGIYEYLLPKVEDEAKLLNVQQSPDISPDIESMKGKFPLRK